MIREEIRDSIAVDWISEDFGYDQVYDSFPCVFPTVWIQLSSTVGLCKLADRIRQADGEMPFFDYDETAGEYDDRGWYDFYVHLNGYNKHHIDTSIYVEPQSEWSYCDNPVYLDISEDEQEYIYQCLNEEIANHGMYDYLGCEDLLKQAADYWKDDIGELTICERSIS